MQREICPVRAQAKLDKSGAPKAEDVVRVYDALIGYTKELAENAARLGGAAGEVLLEECTAKVECLRHSSPKSKPVI